MLNEEEEAHKKVGNTFYYWLHMQNALKLLYNNVPRLACIVTHTSI